MARKLVKAIDPLIGYLLIDAWREEAQLFAADGKVKMADQLRRGADNMERATKRGKS